VITPNFVIIRALSELARGFEIIGMAIIDDHDAIARRLQELEPSTRDTGLDEWRNLAAETARVHVENRRWGPLTDSICHKRREVVTRRPKHSET